MNKLKPPMTFQMFLCNYVKNFGLGDGSINEAYKQIHVFGSSGHETWNI